MDFGSDNWAGAAPQITAALAKESERFAAAYGESTVDKRVEERFNALFEREVAVFFVGTGTAANALSLACVNRPGGAVFCHRDAHIIEDECGAVEHLTGGARLVPVDGAAGKMAPQNLSDELKRFPPDFVHHGQPMAVSITQGTEAGTAYTLDEIDAIRGVAGDLPLHMDGARFANALVRLGATPAEMTWKRGVDMLSFGGTKNGCWSAEAIVFFAPEMARDLPYIRKRAGHLFSKTRFIAAQFLAYLDDDLWLELARRANAQADRLREALRASNRAREAWLTDTNEVFAILPRDGAEAAREAGAVFYDWSAPHGNSVLRPEDDEVLVRLVTSFATEPEDVDRFAALMAK